jgi:hypothetical protein
LSKIEEPIGLKVLNSTPKLPIIEHDDTEIESDKCLYKDNGWAQSSRSASRASMRIYDAIKCRSSREKTDNTMMNSSHKLNDVKVKEYLPDSSGGINKRLVSSAFSRNLQVYYESPVLKEVDLEIVRNVSSSSKNLNAFGSDRKCSSAYIRAISFGSEPLPVVSHELLTNKSFVLSRPHTAIPRQRAKQAIIPIKKPIASSKTPQGLRPPSGLKKNGGRIILGPLASISVFSYC